MLIEFKFVTIVFKYSAKEPCKECQAYHSSNGSYGKNDDRIVGSFKPWHILFALKSTRFARGGLGTDNDAHLNVLGKFIRVVGWAELQGLNNLME